MSRTKSNKVIFKNTSAIQTILGEYAVTGATGSILNLEDDQDSEGIPQTFISEEEKEISLVELAHEKSRRCYYFLDSHKKRSKNWFIMFDFTLFGSLPQHTNKPCWWCRHKFKTRPIGCPLKYNPHKSSGFEKERYEKILKDAGIELSDVNDFFETVGLFCSFPCCKAYILDQKGSLKYSESATLLSLLFYTFYDRPPEFDKAGHWKVIKEHGGHLTIQEFRSSFGRLEFKPSVNMRRPYMYCSSEYITEKKIKPFKQPSKDII